VVMKWRSQALRSNPLVGRVCAAVEPLKLPRPALEFSLSQSICSDGTSLPRFWPARRLTGLEHFAVTRSP